MNVYSKEVMDKYRLQGEGMLGGVSNNKNGEGKNTTVEVERRLPPHAYLTADDAYRAMMRGMGRR
jgi:myosin heavy subunit